MYYRLLHSLHNGTIYDMWYCESWSRNVILCS